MREPQLSVTDLPFYPELEKERIAPVCISDFHTSHDLKRFLTDRMAEDSVTGFVFDTHPPDNRSGASAYLARLRPWLDETHGRINFAIVLELGAPLTDKDFKAINGLFSSGLRLMIWTCPEYLKTFDTQGLWKISKQGIWNHVAGKNLITGNLSPDMKKFMFDNANIVHSYDLDDGENTSSRDILKFQAYSKTAPIPGKPVWKILGQPRRILTVLNLYSARELSGFRLDLDTSRLIQLGSTVTYTFEPPKNLPPGFLDEICNMVDAGGSVDITHVRANLEQAHLIGYAMENGVIVGNSSLKHPRKEFIARLKDMTGVDFTGFVERGYTSVRPEYRAHGVGKELLAGLTANAAPYKVFSIIDEKNLAVQKIAVRNNTRKVLTYHSTKLNKPMGVWVPEHMISQIPELTP